MRKNYMNPDFEVAIFAIEDIVTTSGEGEVTIVPGENETPGDGL